MARVSGQKHANKFRGVSRAHHALKDDYSLDLPTFEKVLDFRCPHRARPQSHGRTTRASR